MAGGLRSRRGPILAVLAYLVLGALFAESVPAWEAPDEPWHLAVAEAIASGRLADPSETYEAHQPPLYYAWVASALRAVGVDSVPRAPDNPWYPYAAAAVWHVPEDPGAALLRLLRTYGGMLGALVVVLTWAAARAAAPHRPGVAGLAAGLVALWPQFAFVAHAISNDVLAAATGALIAFGLVAWLVGSHPRRRALGALFAAGSLVPLSKLNTAPLLLAALAAALVASPARERPWRPLAALLGGSAASLLFLGLLWPSALASLLEQARFRGVETLADAGTTQDFLTRAGGLAASAWARFGWLNVDVPAVARWGGMAALGLASLLAAWATLRASGRERRALAALWVLCGAAVAAALRNLLSDPQPQGRLLFPALPALAILLAFGALETVPRRRTAPVAAACLLALLAVDLVAVLVVIPGAYASSRGPYPRVDVRVMPPERRVAVTLAPDRPAVAQTFRASRDGLSLVALAVAWARGPGSVEITLRDGTGLVATTAAALPLAVAPAGGWLTLAFPSVTDSAGRRFAVEVRVVGGGASTDVGLWGARGDVYADGEATVDGETIADLVLLALSASERGQSPRGP